MSVSELNIKTLDPLERIVLSLRSIYSSYGFLQYKMSKFEEYDFYARNKDFLVSDGVITFTDTNGRLMALKPDVTLSIVKYDSDSEKGVRKVYYDENVYRVSKGTGSFCEIKQTGLECIGDVDLYHVSEVLLLAAKSLRSVSDDFVLVVSDLDILLSLVDKISIDVSIKRELIKCAGEKNIHGLDELGDKYGLNKSNLADLKSIISLYGNVDDVLERLSSLNDDNVVSECTDRLKQTLSVFNGTELSKHIQIDFSIVCDLNYYNGIVFKGYVAGVPESVLSGGQYDRLMEKLNRRSRAIGFAVYLGSLDRLAPVSSATDVDVVLVYNNESASSVRSVVEHFVSQGKSVAAVRGSESAVRCSEKYELRSGEVTRIEDFS